MTKDYKDMNYRQLLGALNGDTERAISLYAELHPETDKSEIAGRFKVVENLRRLSVFGLFGSGGKWTSNYTEDDAVADYLELHPEAKETDVRAELEYRIAQADKRQKEIEAKWG